MQSQNSRVVPSDIQYSRYVADVIKLNPHIIVSTPPISETPPISSHTPPSADALLSTNNDTDPPKVKNAMSTLKSRQ